MKVNRAKAGLLTLLRKGYGLRAFEILNRLESRHLSMCGSGPGPSKFGQRVRSDSFRLLS